MTPSDGRDADPTCYLERSKVREILIASDIDNENTQAVLQEVDALPIVTAADLCAPKQADPSREECLAVVDKIRGGTRDGWGYGRDECADFITRLAAKPAEDGVWKLIGAFSKVTRVMRAARDTPDKLMSIWADDMKAAEDVEAFLNSLSPPNPGQPK